LLLVEERTEEKSDERDCKKKRKSHIISSKILLQRKRFLAKQNVDHPSAAEGLVPARGFGRLGGRIRLSAGAKEGRRRTTMQSEVFLDR